MGKCVIKVRIHSLLYLNLAFFTNYAIFLKLCSRTQFEVNCAKAHHRVISDSLLNWPMGSVLQSSIPSTDKIHNSQFTIIYSLYLWRWVLHRLLKHQSLSAIVLIIVLTRLNKHVHAPTYRKSSYRNYKVIVLHVDKIDVSLIKVNASHLKPLHVNVDCKYSSSPVLLPCTS